MTEILDLLGEEHAKIGRVLDSLERELVRIDRGSPPERPAILEILSYLRDYPAQRHHDKEDQVLRKLKARDAAAAAAAGNLKAQHEELLSLTEQFTATAESVVQVAEPTYGTFRDVARTFLDSYRRHIELEERYLFPAARWSLTEQDWAELKREINSKRPPVASPS